MTTPATPATPATPDPTPTPAPDYTTLQQEIAAVSQVGQAAASPFIHSAQGQAAEARVLGEVNLGIAALPLLATLFQTLGGIFHHMHKTAVASAAAQTPAIPPPTPPTA